MTPFKKIISIIIIVFFVNYSFASKAECGVDFRNMETTESSALDAISATIEGATSVCLNSSPPKITFTGSDGATPYTFTYKLNDGSEQTVSTESEKNKVTVEVPTNIAGTYEYKLIKVADDSGSETLDEKVVVVVNALPNADFTFTDNQCSGVGVKFEPVLIGAAHYKWEFGDGIESFESQPSHIYTSIGCGTKAYTIKLTVKDANGCESFVVKKITIKQKPDISFFDANSAFDPFSNCSKASAASPGYPVTVGNSSSSASCIASYSIDWGDASTLSTNVAFPFSHTYNKLGTFNMVITAMGNNGCSSNVQYVVKNVTNPSGGIISPGTTTDLCAPTADLKFEIAKWGGNSPGTTYVVNFGDGSTNTTLTQEQMEASSYYLPSDPVNSSNYPIPHSYTSANCPATQFVATLTVTSACRSTDFTANSITILTKPQTDFDAPSAVCLNSNVVFTNKTISGNSQNCNKNSIFTWDFGDGTPIQTTAPTLPTNASHIYALPGLYTVTLTAKNYCGETSKVKQIIVNPLPTATMSGNATVCQNAPQPLVTFTGANGTAPYIFTYTINGSTRTVKTISGNSVTVFAPTNASGNFTYSLVSVQESSPSGCSQAQVGSATIVVNSNPTATVTGTESVCLNSISPAITFGGANGIAPYIFTYNVNGGANQTIKTSTGNSVNILVATDMVGVFNYNLVSVQDASANLCTQPQIGTATVTVNQSPAAMTLNNYEFCNGVATPVISFSNSVAGTTYKWTNSNTSIGLVAAGSGNIPSFIATNNTSSSVISTITVTPWINTCPGATQTFTVTVNPSAAVTFSQVNQTICSGENTAEVTLNSTSAGAAFSWLATQPAGVTGVVTSGTNTIPIQTLVNTTNTPISIIYKVKASISGATTCAGAEYSYIIIVNPTPSVSGSLKTTICSGSMFAISPTNGGGNSIPIGTKYSWSAPSINPIGAITGASAQSNQSNISQTLLNTTSEVATATYSVTAITANDCSSLPFDVIVAVNPKPTVTKPTDVVLCDKETFAELPIVGNVLGVVYNWSSTNSSIGIGSSGVNKIPTFEAVNNGTSPIMATITVTPTYTNDGVSCEGALQQFTITVNPAAQVNMPASLVVCDGQNGSTVFTTKNTGGITTYAWTNDNPSVGLLSSGNGDISFVATNPTNVPIKALVNVTPTYTNAGKSCTGMPEEFEITVNPKGQVNNPGDQLVCKGKNVTVAFSTVKSSGITSYAWSNTNPTIGLDSSGNGDLSFEAKNNTNVPITGKITVIPTFGTGSTACLGTPQLFDITVNPSASVLFSPAPQVICTGNNTMPVILSSTSSNVTYEWTAVQPTGITGVLTTGTTTIPTQNLVNETNAPITIEYKAKATVTGSAVCSGQEYIYKITVNPKPVVVLNQNVTICSGDTYSFAPADGSGNIVPVGTKYTWSEPIVTPTAGALIGFSAQNTAQTSFNQVLTNTTADIAKATYTVVPETNGCVGASFEIEVNVNPKPIITPVADVTLCNGAKFPELVFTGNVTGAVYNWTSDNTSIGIANVGLDKITEFTATNLDTVPIIAKMTVTPKYDNGGVTCNGAEEYFTITVNPTAQVNNSGSIVACNAVSNTIHFTTKNTVGTTTYSWTNNNLGANTGIGASGNGDIAFTPSNSGVTDISTTITVIPTFTNNGISCEGTPEIFDIIVHPTPVVDALTDQTVCNGYPTSDIHFVGNSTATVYKWTNSNSSIGLAANGTGDIVSFNAINVGALPVKAMITVTPWIDGCQGLQKTVTITVNSSPNISSQPKSSVLCKDETALALSVAYNNSNEVPLYQWYSYSSKTILGALPIAGANSATYMPSSSTVGVMYYYCTLKFPTGGCDVLKTDIATVTVNQYPIVSNYTSLIGSGTTFTVTPTTVGTDIVPANTTYTWSAPNIVPANSITGAAEQLLAQSSISQLLVNPTKAVGTVTYNVTPRTGDCVGKDFKVVVTVNPPISPNAIVTNISCFAKTDGFITTNIQGGIPDYTILWSGPNGFTSANPTINNLIAGTYTLKITDKGGLPFTQDYIVIEPEDITLAIDIQKNVSCNGASNGEIAITAKGGTGAYKYSWTKDNVYYANTDDIASLSPGKYEITVTDANNCNPKSLPFEIREPDPLIIKLLSQSDVKCAGESIGVISVSVTGGTQIEILPGVYDYKYAWVGPSGFVSSNKNLTNIAAGSYTLTVTDKAGCSNKLDVTIAQPGEIKIAYNTTPITCYGAKNASITLALSGGVPNYDVHWAYSSTDIGFEDTYATGEFQENLAAGYYNVTVTDANGCSKSTVINIPEAPMFRIMPVVKNVSCFGAKDGSITLNFEGGRKPITLKWSDNSLSGTTRNNIGPGTYTVVISDGTPCVIHESFTILEPKPLLLSANITHALDCDNIASGAIDLLVEGGTAPYKYKWSNGSVDEDLIGVTARKYFVSVMDVNGCERSAQYEITRPAPLEISVTTITNLNCSVKEVSKIATATITGGVPPYEFKWSTGKISGVNNEIAQIYQSGNVMLEIVDAKGCNKHFSFNVEIPSIGINNQLLDCDKHSYIFNAKIPGEIDSYDFSWSFGDGGTSILKTPTHIYSIPGIYNVTLEYKTASCVLQFKEVLVVEDLPKVELDKQPIFCPGDSIILHAIGANSYRWNDGSTADSLLIKQPGDYSVLGISKAGCAWTLNFKATNFVPYNYTIVSNKEEISTEDPTVQLSSESILYSDYFWEFGDGKSSTGNYQDHQYDNLKSGYYVIKLKVKNPNGCIEYANKKIWTRNASTYNVFTPNGDGIDDVFMKGWKTKVYNRNGVLLYDDTVGWNGTYKGKPVAADTYFYVLYNSTVSGMETDTGFITVIR